MFRRRITTLSAYTFSETLKHLDIVWSPETIAKLFEIAPRATRQGP
jgi:cytochrome c